MNKEIKRKLRRIWCERLFIGLSVSVALGFSIAKVQSVYSQTNLIKEAQAEIQAKQQAEIQAKQQADMQTGLTKSKVKEFEDLRLTKLEVKEFEDLRLTKLEVKEFEEAVKFLHQSNLQAQQQKLQQELLFLVISVLCFILMLILLLRQRKRISLTLTGQFICFFPEECIAELEALRQQLKSDQHSILLIRIILLCTVIEFFWVFYVKINIENLRLPQQRGRKNIDE